MSPQLCVRYCISHKVYADSPRPNLDLIWWAALRILLRRPVVNAPAFDLVSQPVTDSDTLTALLWPSILLVGTILFVAVGCNSGGKVNELRQENERLRQKLDAAQGEAASLQRGQTVEVLSTDVYFKSGSAELTSTGVEELKRVAQRIREEFPDRTIRIEGYTDSQPIGQQLADRFPSNWELSAARAARVARHFRWTHDMDPDRFEVVGFGSQHPVATNETEEGRRKNRRVRVAVLQRPPTPE